MPAPSRWWSSQVHRFAPRMAAQRRELRTELRQRRQAQLRARGRLDVPEGRPAGLRHVGDTPMARDQSRQVLVRLARRARAGSSSSWTRSSGPRRRSSITQTRCDAHALSRATRTMRGTCRSLRESSRRTRPSSSTCRYRADAVHPEARPWPCHDDGGTTVKKNGTEVDQHEARRTTIRMPQVTCPTRPGRAAAGRGAAARARPTPAAPAQPHVALSKTSLPPANLQLLDERLQALRESPAGPRSRPTRRRSCSPVITIST